MNKGHLDIVTFLISNGADVNSRDDVSTTIVITVIIITIIIIIIIINTDYYHPFIP